jgi:hypothetical protein
MWMAAMGNGLLTGWHHIGGSNSAYSVFNNGADNGVGTGESRVGGLLGLGTVGSGDIIGGGIPLGTGTLGGNDLMGFSLGSATIGSEDLIGGGIPLGTGTLGGNDVAGFALGSATVGSGDIIGGGLLPKTV